MNYTLIAALHTLSASCTTLCCYVKFPTPHLYLTNIVIITNIRHYLWLMYMMSA